MRKNNLLFFLILLSSALFGKVKNDYPTIFSSLDSVKQYVADYPEYPEIDNIDWSQPDYSTYLKSVTPGYFNRFIHWLGFIEPLWDIWSFKLLLERVTKERELNGYIGRFILKFDPPPGSEFIVFGDLNSAFASFSRDLSYLELRGYINEDLTLKPGCFFVFNGNAIDKSPFSLETLTLVMQIMNKNPGRVFYIRGTHEDKEKWTNYSLKTELMIRAEHLGDNEFTMEKIPLHSLINRFFNTLPLALYLVSERTSTEINVVRISRYGFEERDIKEKKFAGFLDLPDSGSPEMFKINKEFLSKKKVNIKALITGERLDIYYKKTPGLRFLGKEQGINTWATISSPIDSHRRLYEFFYDAFAVVTAHEKVNEWTIALYNQDVRSKLGFKRSRVDNIVTGIEITGKEKEVAVSDEKSVTKLEQELKAAQDEIKELKEDVREAQEECEKPVQGKEGSIKKKEFKLGSTLDLTRVARDVGSAYKEGMLLAIDEINKKGGVNDIFLKLDVLDDGYIPERARKNVEDLIKKNIDILVLPLGSSTLNAYIDLVKEKKIAVLFPATGVMDFHKPDLKYLINYRLSNELTSEIITNYMINKNQKKFAFLYRDDSLGKNSRAGAIKALKNREIEKWNDLPFDPRNKIVTKQVEALKSKQFDTLGFFALAPSTKNFITSVEESILSGKKLFGIDPLTERNFQDFVKKRGLVVSVPYQVPNPKTSKIQIAQDYASAAKALNKELSPFALEGYLSIKLLAEIMKNLDPPITNKKIIDAFESVKNYDFGGMKLYFDAESRTLNHPLWIYDGSFEWKEVGIDTGKKVSPELVSETDHVIKGKIKIGSTMDMTKSEKVMGRDTKQVLTSYMSEVNQSGGIKGKEVELSILKDGYNPDQALKNVKKLISQGSGLLLNPLGSPTLTNYLNLVRDKKTMVFFPLGNSPKFFDSSLNFLLNFGPSYSDEGYYMIHFLEKRINFQKILVFYQDTIPGIIDGARKALKELGKEWIEIAYNPVSVDYSKQIEKLRNEKPDSIIFFTTATFVKNIIRQMGLQFFVGKIILGGISWSLSSNTLKKFLSSQGLEYIIPSYVPNPVTSTLPIVQEFRRFAQRNSIDINPYALQSYLCAKLLQKFISEVNGELTWEKIMGRAEKLNDFDLGGISFSFDPEKRNILNSIWIDGGKADWEKVLLIKDQQSQPKKRDKPLKHVIEGNIKIGSTMDLSRGEKDMGREVQSTLISFADSINSGGGINGRKIDLTILDDGYSVTRVLKNINKLMKNGSGLILNPLGTPLLPRYLDLVKDENLMVFFPIAGTPRSYSKNLSGLLNYGASYVEEGYAVINHVFGKIKRNKKVAFFYQEQGAAVGASEGIERALTENGISNWVSLSYDLGTVDFKKQVDKLKKENPDVIIFFASQSSLLSFIRQAGLEYFYSKMIVLGSTFQVTNSLRDFFKSNDLTYVIPSKVPNPKKSILPIVKEFRNFAKKNSIKLETISLFTYISFTLLEKFISEVKGELTWKKIMGRAEQLKDFDLGGLTFSFDAKTRKIYDSIWIDSGKTSWERVSLKEQIKKLPEKVEDLRFKEEIKGNIKIGSTLDLSRAEKGHGKPIKSVLSAYASDINESGGIKGKKIDLTILDDGYKRLRARENVESLLKNGTNALLSPFGTPTLESYLSFVNSGQVMVFFPLSGGSNFYDKDLKNLVNYGLSYAEEGDAVINYVVNKFGKRKKLALFYQKQAAAFGSIDGARKALKEKGISDFVSLGYNVGTVNFEKQVEKLKKENPEIIISFGSASSIFSFVRQVGVDYFFSKIIVGGITFQTTPSLINFLNSNNISYIFPSKVPNPVSSDLSIVKNFRRFAQKNSIELDSISLVSYISFTLLKKFISEVKGELTWEKIMSRAELLKDFDLGGITFSFDPEARRISNSIWMNSGKAEWEKLTVKETTPRSIKRGDSNKVLEN